MFGLRELENDGGTVVSKVVPRSMDAKHKMLEVSGLSMAYKKHLVQQDLSFDLGEGEILGITGVNGAGKTTLLRTLAGLAKPCTGEIFLHGKKTNAKARRKNFGMVMQDVNYQLFADSCENECMLGNPQIDEKKATELLHEAGKAIIVVTHDKEFLELVCDRILELKKLN